MRNLKQVLQDWLGITAIAERVAEMDLDITDTQLETISLGTLGLTSLQTGIDAMSDTPLSDTIKKGYDKPE